MNTENFKNKRREAKEINRAKKWGGGTDVFKVLAGMEQSRKWGGGTDVFNPFPSLTLQSARDLKVPSPSKRSKAFLV